MDKNVLAPLFCLTLFTAQVQSDNVTNAADLQTAIINANAGSTPTVNFLNDVSVGSGINFRPLNANPDFTGANRTYTIEGNNFTLSLQSNTRGFFVAGSGLSMGQIAINNLMIDQGLAKGGDGGQGGTCGGGGGAGMGGGLFVGSGATVVLTNVQFNNNKAQGGNGGSTNPTLGSGPGGGGGLGGNGGDTFAATQFIGAAGGGGFLGNGGIGGDANFMMPVFAGAGAGGGGALTDGTSPLIGMGGNDFSGVSGGGAPAMNGLNGGGGGGATWFNFGGNGGFGGGGGVDKGGDGDAFQASGPGTGGFGGGGGGSLRSTGGPGGFGGGGGGSDTGVTGAGGPGGFGGGGGGVAASPHTIGPGGFCAGNGATSFLSGSAGGGGGGALGGSIFVQNGGQLTIQDKIVFNNSSLQGGLGGSPDGVNGGRCGVDIFMMSGGSATFTLTSDSVVPNPITSDKGVGGGSTATGGIIVNGSAALTLNGNNLFTGTTDVQSGGLLLNGSVITPVTTNGGTFTGNATVKSDLAVPNSGNLTNNSGSVVPGNGAGGQMVVEGTYVQAAAGSIGFDVSNFPTTPQLQVSGNATLGGTLNLTNPKGNYIVGTIATLINSGGTVSNSFATINGPSFLGPIYSSNAMSIIVLDSVFFLNQVLPASGNASRVADYIENGLVIGPNTDLAFVVTVLGQLSSGQLKKALDELNPALFGGLEWANLNNSSYISSLVSQRSMELSCSPRGCRHRKDKNTVNQEEGKKSEALSSSADHKEAGSHERQNGVWIQPFGEWSVHDKLGQVHGFRSNSGGVMAGYDRCFSEFMFGGALGYTHTDMGFHFSKSSGDINRVYGGLYGAYFKSFFTADLSVFGGENFYQMKRRISYHSNTSGESVKRHAKSHHNGYNFFSHLGMNFDFAQYHVPLQVFNSVDHVYLNQDGFKERGAQSLNLKIGKHISNMLRTELGVATAKTFQFGKNCWQPYLGVSWVNKTPLSSTCYHSHFQDQHKSFRSVTTHQAINQWSPQIGLVVTLKNGLSFSIGGKSELSGKFKSYYADGALDYVF